MYAYHRNNHYWIFGRSCRQVADAWARPGGFVVTALLGIVGASVATYLGQAIGWYRADEGSGFLGSRIAGRRDPAGDIPFGTTVIPRSHDNPEFLWVDDPEVVRDLVAVSAPVPGYVVAQEVQHCDAEVLEGAVAFVVGSVSVHQPP